MSYILDALKKAEKERQRGMIPNLSTNQHPPPKQKKRSIWPYIVVIVLLVTAGVLFFWLRPWKSKEPTIVAKTTVADTQKPQSVESSSELSDSQLHTIIKQRHQEKKVSSEVKAFEEDALSDLKPIKTSQEPPKTAQQKQPAFLQTEEKASPEEKASEKDALSDLKPVEATQEPPKTAQQKQPAPLQTEQEEKPSVVDTGESPESSSPAVQEPLEPTASDDSSPPTSTEPVLSNRIYTLQNLPASVKETLPPIHISVFIYSDDPNSRIVNINGQSVREGQDLADGLTVEKIVPDGVIFNYEAYRFHVGIK